MELNGENKAVVARARDAAGSLRSGTLESALPHL